MTGQRTARPGQGSSVGRPLSVFHHVGTILWTKTDNTKMRFLLWRVENVQECVLYRDLNFKRRLVSVATGNGRVAVSKTTGSAEWIHTAAAESSSLQMFWHKTIETEVSETDLYHRSGPAALLSPQTSDTTSQSGPLPPLEPPLSGTPWWEMRHN